jgi:serine/threonine protein phosphatase 1
MTRALPRTADDLCVYAIGDIHGHKNKLQQLMAMIGEDAAQWPGPHRLVFLGDYIDRGPDSQGVIEYFMHDIQPSFQSVFLRGNHEDIALRVLGGETELIASWMQFGGAAFLASYGVNPFRARIMESPEVLQAELAERMPPQHRRFLESTVYSYGCGDYYFAHAGVRPGIDLTKQDSTDLMWIRQEFLGSKQDFGKIVVHGHSISTAPDVKINRIGIDTGAYATGKLTGLKLWGSERRFFTT